MLQHIIKRVVLLIPTLTSISIVAFFVIGLRPGDDLITHMANLHAGGDSVDQQQLEGSRSYERRLHGPSPC